MEQAFKKNKLTVANGSLLYAQCNLELGWIRAQSRLPSSPKKIQKIAKKLALKCSPGTFLEPERDTLWYNNDDILYENRTHPSQFHLLACTTFLAVLSHKSQCVQVPSSSIKPMMRFQCTCIQCSSESEWFQFVFKIKLMMFSVFIEYTFLYSLR